MNRYRNWTERQLEEAVSKLSGKLGDIKMQARDKKRDLTDEEYGLVCEIEGEISELRSHLKKFEPANAPKTLVGFSNGPTITDQTPSNGPAKDRTFRGMFYQEHRNHTLDMGGWGSSGEFLEVLNSGRHDPRLIRATHTEGSQSAGGFSVPEQMTAQWLDSSLPTEIIRSRATVWPMSSSTRKIPGWDDFDQSSGAYFGGLTMQFLAEAGTGTYQTAKLRSIELIAKKGAIFAITEEEWTQVSADRWVQ